MSVNFRKKVQVAPGMKLNFSKSGVSTTIGGKGGSVNVGKNGVYANASIPGTGLYSRQKISSTSSKPSQAINEKVTAYEWVMLVCLIFSMFMFIFCVLFPHFERLHLILIPGIVAQVIFWLMWLGLKD